MDIVEKGQVSWLVHVVLLPLHLYYKKIYAILTMELSLSLASAISS